MSAIPEGGTVSLNSVVLGATLALSSTDPLQLQVEVEPVGTAFTGLPTASSSLVSSGAFASATVSGLANGSYHWQARALDTDLHVASGWTPFNELGHVDFVVAVKEPVIIVPGVGGTYLNRVSNNDQVWPHVSGLDGMFLSGSDAYLDDLQLTTNGQQIIGREMKTEDVIRSDTGQVVYGNLIGAFTQAGYVENQNLFVVPYDWRMDVSLQTDILGAKVAEAIKNSPTGKVNIIAHSLGGLLVKQYLASTSTSQSIDKVVLVGVPQLGAPQSFKDLIEGDNFDIYLLFYPILNPQEVQKIMQNMPSVYQLLPSRKYIQDVGSYVQDWRTGSGHQFLDYDQTFHALQNLDSSANVFLSQSADALHASLDDQPISASHVYHVVGCLSPTPSQFNLYDNNVVDIERSTGDGTVPVPSAMNLAANDQNYFVLGNETGIEHMGLIADSRPLALVKSIIDGTVSTSSLPQGISASTADCFTPRPQFQNESTIEFSTHSPVTLDVYDSEGRHTGLLPSGDIEIGIPGSQYEKFGENSFALVPAGDAYKVIDQGTATGTFTMKVKGYVGSTVDTEAAYLAVPLDGTSTKAELNFSSFDGNMGLQLDSNGDGAKDAVVQPAAILSASSAADIASPVITMPDIASTTTVGSPLAFNFSATDDLSGIAVLSGTLDGKPIASGTILSNIPIGVHTLTVQAIDKAGNPAVRQMSFNVIYTFRGFLPPLNSNGAYKIGRTLPVKFQLTDANGKFISTAIAKLFLATITNGATGKQISAVSTSAADSGNLFRYDFTSNQYIFNLNTSSLTSGIWQLQVQLDDGKVYTVNILMK